MSITATVFEKIGGSDVIFMKWNFVLVFSREIHHITSHDIILFRKREWITTSSLRFSLEKDGECNYITITGYHLWEQSCAKPR